MNPKKKLAAGLLVLTALGLSFCKKEQPVNTASTDSAQVPVLPERAEPYPNNTSYDLATLGRVLFYDKELSVNKNVACGSCHKAEYAEWKTSAHSRSMTEPVRTVNLSRQ